MVSATMAVQEEHGCRGLDSHILKGGNTSLNLATTMVKDARSKEQLNNAGDGFAPKVRKPYTITKQREKWTEEEHKKFLKALKLYGRAWRRIEEHVGTKTAVQIRSHAQKFFSKVTREAKNGVGNSVKPIEIPPPRPKRKPMHPYPRKMISQDNMGISPPEEFANANEEENQSSTSVLSGLGSDSSCTPNGNRSSVTSEVPKLVSEDVMSNLPEREDENSITNERIHMDVGLSSENENSLVKEDLTESATLSLKLFGKTLLITGPCRLSDPVPKTCKPEFPNIDYESSNVVDVSTHPISFPWLTLWSDNAFVQNPGVHSPTPIRARSLGENNNNRIKEKSDDNEKEGLFTGSSTTDLVSFERERGGKSFFFYKSTKRRTSGFMPYKRCSDEQDSTLLVAERNEQRETQRVRLCL